MTMLAGIVNRRGATLVSRVKVNTPETQKCTNLQLFKCTYLVTWIFLGIPVVQELTMSYYYYKVVYKL